MNQRRHHGRSRTRSSCGFTLFEMVVVMGIVAILLAIAVPSYRYVTTSNRIAAEINGLLGDLQFARAEAIKEGQPVTACVSTNGTSCTNNTSWNKGWIIFSDANGDGAVTNGTDYVIRYQPAFTSTDTFVSNNQTLLTFNRTGFQTVSANNTYITLHATPATTASTRCLFLLPTGTPIVLTPADGNSSCS